VYFGPARFGSGLRLVPNTSVDRWYRGVKGFSGGLEKSSGPVEGLGGRKERGLAGFAGPACVSVWVGSGDWTGDGNWNGELSGDLGSLCSVFHASYCRLHQFKKAGRERGVVSQTDGYTSSVSGWYVDGSYVGSKQRAKARSSGCTLGLGSSRRSNCRARRRLSAGGIGVISDKSLTGAGRKRRLVDYSETGRQFNSMVGTTL